MELMSDGGIWGTSDVPWQPSPHLLIASCSGRWLLVAQEYQNLAMPRLLVAVGFPFAFPFSRH